MNTIIEPGKAKMLFQNMRDTADGLTPVVPVVVEDKRANARNVGNQFDRIPPVDKEKRDIGWQVLPPSDR